MPADKLRALVIDDSALYRKVVRTVLEELPEVEVIGAATNGRVGLELVKRDSPDLVTLDLEMPELDGLGFLRESRNLAKKPAAIMLSSLTAKGAKVTTEALELGAFDFILKPSATDLDLSLAQIRQQLIPKVQAVLFSKTYGRASRCESPVPEMLPPAAPNPFGAALKPEILAIGVSTGGPAALTDFLPKLSANFPLPILIVQHMPPVFTRNLAEDLNNKCRLKVREAQGGECPLPGEVYLAPGGKQMKLEAIGTNRVIRITDDAPERSCKPSVDYLFRSLSQVCGNKTLALIMTGMGDDGLLGCKLLKRQGGRIFAQSRETCVVYGMPKCIVDAGLAEEVIDLKSLPERLTQLASKEGVLTCR